MTKRNAKTIDAPTATATIAIFARGEGIAALVQEMANLHKLHDACSNAEGPAERARKKIADVKSEDHDRCCAAIHRMSIAERRSHAMAGALARLILTLEPTTPNETLSLALILVEEFDTFLCNHVDHKDDHHVQAEMHRLMDAFHALIRGIVIGSMGTSPLWDRYTTEDSATPWGEARSRASHDANLYRLEYDPVEGQLRQTGAEGEDAS